MQFSHAINAALLPSPAQRERGWGRGHRARCIEHCLSAQQVHALSPGPSPTSGRGESKRIFAVIL